MRRDNQMPTSGAPSRVPPNQAETSPSLVSTIVEACALANGAVRNTNSEPTTASGLGFIWPFADTTALAMKRPANPRVRYRLITRTGARSQRATLRTELPRQVVEVLRRDIDGRIRIQVGLAVWPEFKRSRHERCRQTDALGCAKIAQVGGHHHHFRELEIENIRRRLIDLPVRLV